MNRIFSRMGNLKLSRLKDYDEEGNLLEDLSNVEMVLRKEGIALRDAEGQFRNFNEVLDETATIWKKLQSEGNTVSQRAIAQAFAG